MWLVDSKLNDDVKGPKIIIIIIIDDVEGPKIIIIIIINYDVEGPKIIIIIIIILGPSTS